MTRKRSQIRSRRWEGAWPRWRSEKVSGTGARRPHAKMVPIWAGNAGLIFKKPQTAGLGEATIATGNKDMLHRDVGSFPAAPQAPTATRLDLRDPGTPWDLHPPARRGARRGRRNRGSEPPPPPRPRGTSRDPPPAQSEQTPSSKPRCPSPRPLKLTPGSAATGDGPPELRPPEPRGHRHRFRPGRRCCRALVLLGPPSPRKH